MEVEKEVVELFEKAKKAADEAAALEGGEEGVAEEESRCIDALTLLKNFPVTYQVLVSTQVGKCLRSLTKHPRKNIQASASDLVEMWKNIVLKEANNEKKNGSLQKSNSLKVRNEDAENGKPLKVQKTIDENGKAIKFDKVTPVNDEVAETVQVRKTELRQGEESAKPLASPKLTAVPRCNDPWCERVREQLVEGLLKVSGEAEEEIKAQVDGCDPIQVAVSVECAMFEMWGRSNGSFKVKYRSTLFNMKDPNNPDFRRKVLLGEIKPEKLVTLTAQEMASERRQLENNHIKEKALVECELGAGPQATTDEFKCGRCGQRQTTDYQMQTRSADKPMTTYVTCINCNNR